MTTELPGSGSPLSIHAVSELLSIPAPTIHSWERRYGVAQTARTAGGHRRCLAPEIAELRLMRDEISRGRRSADAAALIRDAASSAEPYRSVIQAFVDVAETMNAAQMDVLLDDCINRFGLDDAICCVVLPGMRLIGVAWQTGRCDISQEHLVTRATRTWLQKILSRRPAPSHSQRILLSCGPEDLHTIGLEAMVVPGVATTLTDLGTRHDLLLLTKGQVAEQQNKLDVSGLGHHFRSIHIVAEKNVETYRLLVQKEALTPGETWMIGNSPKSDINPGRSAGLNAVFLPNDNTWILEHDDIDPTDDGVLRLGRFPELLEHF